MYRLFNEHRKQTLENLKQETEKAEKCIEDTRLFLDANEKTIKEYEDKLSEAKRNLPGNPNP